MIAWTHAFLFLGALCYTGAALEIAVFLRDKDRREIAIGTRFALAGAACFALAGALRWLHWERPPFTTASDNLNLFIVLATLTMLAVLRRAERRGLMCFYLPPLALLAIVSAALGWRDWSAPPKDIGNPLIFVHVWLAFLAYAFFLVASLTSAAYLFQANRLKHRKTTGLFQRLPSLEHLDKTLHRLISVGYPMFIVTLALGIFWAWQERALLGSAWWFSPKILLSALMVLLYAASYHLRALGWLRGPKLAYLVFSGFSAFLGLYLLLEILRVKDHNFWGSV